MKTLFLHIGTHKTGTTALQQFLSLNRELLAQKGWLYPRAGCPESHHGHHEIAWGFMERKVFDFGLLKREIEESPCDRVVLSSEEFEFCRNTDRVRDAFEYCEVRVVLYLRRQDDLLLSEYNQHLKSGIYFKPLAQFAKLLKLQGRLDYLGLCQRWAMTFGKDVIIARVYYPDTSIIDDFCGEVGLPKAELSLPANRFANRSFNPSVTGVLKVLNQLRQKGVSESTYKDLFGLVRQFAAQLDNEKKFSLMSPAERKNFMGRYEKSNRRLYASFLIGQEFNDPLVENAGEAKVSENRLPLALVVEMLLHLAKQEA
ncbi:MAG: hypothetical protein L0H94_05625 [Nitrospira sp.]|nr:hypothetical protein [Nitrospira sp.]